MGEEKEIIKSESSPIIPIACVGLVILGIVVFALIVDEFLTNIGSFYIPRSLPSRMAIAFRRGKWYCCIPIVSFIIAVFGCFMVINSKITVTDKRVYGKSLFGKRIDLSIDSIVTISTSALQGISIATATGKINFLGIKNNIAVCEAVNKLLREQPQKAPAPAPTTVMKENNPNEAEQLKQFKELLDSGAITQEEYDAKKKQILGI